MWPVNTFAASIASVAILCGAAAADDRAGCKDESGPPANAIAACGRLIDSGQVTGAELAATHIWRGSHQTFMGQHDGAIADYTKALNIDPGLAGAYRGRGASHEGKGDLAHALADYRMALSLQSSLNDVAEGVKRLEAKLADVDKPDADKSDSSYCIFTGKEFEKFLADCTRSIAKQLLRSEPSGILLSRYYGGRGSAFEDNGQLELALSDYEEAMRRESRGETYLYIGRARVVELMGDYDRASTLYREAIPVAGEAIRRSPNAVNFSNRFYLNLAIGDYDGAVADAGEMIRIAPMASNYNDRATAYALKGELDKAVAELATALRLDPNYGIAYVTRGWIRERSGQLDEAMDDYSLAIRLNPKSAQAYAGRSRVWEAKGRTDLARTDLETARTLDPDLDGWYVGLLGASLERGGQRERALREYEWALRINPANVQALRGRERITSAQTSANRQ
jgi:tetratricopeptide (TPR) repeat protein